MAGRQGRVTREWEDALEVMDVFAMPVVVMVSWVYKLLMCTAY